MNVAMSLDSLEKVIESMEGRSQLERLSSYTVVKALLRELEEYAAEQEQGNCPIPNVGIYIAEMDAPLRCLAGLDDNCHGDIQQFSWLRTSLRKLRSVHCFNLM